MTQKPVDKFFPIPQPVGKPIDVSTDEVFPTGEQHTTGDPDAPVNRFFPVVEHTAGGARRSTAVQVSYLLHAFAGVDDARTHWNIMCQMDQRDSSGKRCMSRTHREGLIAVFGAEAYQQLSTELKPLIERDADPDQPYTMGELLQRVISAEVWRGTEARNLLDFVTLPPPVGLGATVAQLREMAADDPDALALLEGLKD